MTLPQVDATDLAVNYHGDLGDFETAYLDNKLGVVVDKAQSQWGSLIQARIDSGVLTMRLYKAAICDAVLRLVNNPDGYISETEGTYTYRVSQQVAAGWLYFSAENVRDLTGIGAASNVIGTARIGIMDASYGSHRLPGVVG